MMKKILLFCVAVVLLASCGRHKPEVVTVEQITGLKDLGTVEYTVSKIVKATDDQNILALFGTRKIIFSTESTLKAGFDMGELTDDDIRCNPAAKSIHLRLPAPKLLSLSMRPEDIRLVYAESTGLRGEFTAEERNALLAQGEADIRNSVDQLGILDDAKRYGKDYFESMLKDCGYEKIEITFR